MQFVSTLILAAGITLSPVITAAAAGETSSRQPNLIYIMADDLGYGDLGCFGQKQIETHHLLARPDDR